LFYSGAINVIASRSPQLQRLVANYFPICVEDHWLLRKNRDACAWANAGFLKLLNGGSREHLWREQRQCGQTGQCPDISHAAAEVSPSIRDRGRESRLFAGLLGSFDLFETQIEHIVFIPANSIEVPPFTRKNLEAMCFHHPLKQPAILTRALAAWSERSGFL
jgi:hypothetical protein